MGNKWLIFILSTVVSLLVIVGCEQDPTLTPPPISVSTVSPTVSATPTTTSTPYPSALPLLPLSQPPTPTNIPDTALWFVLDRSDSIGNCSQEQQQLVYQVPQFFISYLREYLGQYPQGGETEPVQVNVSTFPGGSSGFTLLQLVSHSDYNDLRWFEEIENQVKDLEYGLEYREVMEAAVTSISEMNGRKFIILITDGSFGADGGSQTARNEFDIKMKELLIIHSDVQVITLLLNNCRRDAADNDVWSLLNGYPANEDSTSSNPATAVRFHTIRLSGLNSVGHTIRNLFQTEGTSNSSNPTADGLLKDLAPSPQSGWIIDDTVQSIRIPGEAANTHLKIVTLGATSFNLEEASRGMNDLVNHTGHLRNVFYYNSSAQSLMGCPDYQWQLSGQYSWPANFVAYYWWEATPANFSTSLTLPPTVHNNEPLAAILTITNGQPLLANCYQAQLFFQDNRGWHPIPQIPLANSSTLSWDVPLSLDSGPQTITVTTQLVSSFSGDSGHIYTPHAIASSSSSTLASFEPVLPTAESVTVTLQDCSIEKKGDNEEETEGEDSSEICTLTIPLNYFQANYYNYNSEPITPEVSGYTTLSKSELDDNDDLSDKCTRVSAYPTEDNSISSTWLSYPALYQSGSWDEGHVDSISPVWYEHEQGYTLRFQEEWIEDCEFVAFSIAWPQSTWKPIICHEDIDNSWYCVKRDL